MDRLEPIPSPPGHLLREFLHRAVPILAFVGAAIGVGVVWHQRFVGTMLFGEVEPIHTDVTTIQAGTITTLCVERFQQVTNGQVIAILETMDADAAGRAMEVMRTELQVLRSRMSIDEARNDQNVEDVRIRWLESRVNLATSKVTLENSRRELERASRLFADKIISEAEFETTQSVHSALEAEVRERTTLADGFQKTIDRLDSVGRRDRGTSLEVLNQSLAAQEKKLQESRTITLRSPMDGMVKVLNHHNGERIPAGTALTSITSAHSEHIVGFVRQPLILDPRPGMSVEIRTRGPKRQIATSSIRSVGSDLELAGSPLRLRGFDSSVERGLAFFVDLPPGLDVHPGELVDLIVHPAPPTKVRD